MPSQNVSKKLAMKIECFVRIFYVTQLPHSHNANRYVYYSNFELKGLELQPSNPYATAHPLNYPSFVCRIFFATFEYCFISMKIVSIIEVTCLLLRLKLPN